MTDADFTAMAARERLYLFHLCARRLDTNQDAEEAMQDTFVKAWIARDHAPPSPDDQHRWLAVIARNTCLDRIRRGARWTNLYPTLPRPSSPDPAAIALMNIELATVDAAMGALAPWECEALALEGGDYSGKEMAAMTGMTVAGFKSRVNRARLRLKARCAA